MRQRYMKYNPAFLTEDDLIRTFVVRHKELEMIVDDVRKNTGESNQHVLIVGPRGIGKTTLALRVAAEVRRDPDLGNQWYPLVFAEESYMVSSPGEFWLESLFHLHQQEQRSKEYNGEWLVTYNDLREEKNEERLRERALAQLMDFADSQKKRIMLIVENLNMLLGELLTHEDAWVLRHTLQNEPRIMLLASATCRFDEVENSDKAMFDLFKTYNLNPLDEKECEAVWKAVTGSEFKGGSIRPIEILTGGSPRLLTIISSFGAKMSFRELMDDLMRLVDDHTEYFKSHLDHLAAIERKVYLALVELWEPVTAREVSKTARLDVNKVSSLLKRLRERGAVVLAKEIGHKKLYQVSERLYNIFYLMRRRGASSSRVKAVVHFMTGFYSPDELADVTVQIAKEACTLHPELRQDHFILFDSLFHSEVANIFQGKLLDTIPRELAEAPDAPDTLKYQYKEEKEQKVNDLIKEGDTFYKDSNKLDEAENCYRKAIELEPNNCDARSQLILLLKNNKQYEKAVKECQKALDLKIENLWVFWAYLGDLYHLNLDMYKEAEEAYQNALNIKPDFYHGWSRLGFLYLYNLRDYKKAEYVIRKVIDLNPDVATGWAQLGELLLRHLGRYEEAEDAYRKVIKREPNNHRAWYQLILLYSQYFNDFEEAKAACLNLIHLKPENIDSWIQRGIAFQIVLKRYDEAETSLRKAIEIDPNYSNAWGALGQFLYQCKNHNDEAEAALRKAIDLNPNNSEAWVSLGQFLFQCKKEYKEAEKALRKSIELDPEYLRAWGQLGILLSEHLERYDEAEITYYKAIDIFPNKILIYWGLKSLIELYANKIKQPEKIIKIIKIADELFEKYPDDYHIYNALAWGLYEHGGPDNLDKAEEWSDKSLQLEPGKAECLHTYATILTAKREIEIAMAVTERYLEHPDEVKKWIDEATNHIIELAALGYASEVLRVLSNSPSAEILEPLVVGLRLYTGEDVKTAYEILEVGKDVRDRIISRTDQLHPPDEP